MCTLAPPVGRGWEYVDGAGWDWDAELAVHARAARREGEGAERRGRAATTWSSTRPTSGSTIHESIGHATEYDRAIGYEAAYAGTSFATPDKLGTLRYGSPSCT